MDLYSESLLIFENIRISDCFFNDGGLIKIDKSYLDVQNSTI